MDTTRQSPNATRSIVRAAHLLVGAAIMAFAIVLIVAGRAPGSELDGVLLGWGLMIALTGAAVTAAAVLALRRGQDGGSLSLVLSIAEVVAGATLGVALAIAVQGYGAFEPWRSPLLLPAVLLLALGLTGLRLEGSGRRSVAAHHH
jgi:hypothetical protein